MKVENGKFYFIKDEFFDIFKDYKLMQNKENGNKRPCYFCFNDPENKEIIWFVPISSKVDKYKVIYENKKKNCPVGCGACLRGNRRSRSCRRKYQRRPGVL